MLKDKIKNATGIVLISFITCVVLFVGFILGLFMGQNFCDVGKLISEDSHFTEMTEIAESKLPVITELTEEIPLEVEAPLNPNEYPTQERLEEIYDEIYDIAMDNNFNDVQLLYELADCESDFRQWAINDIGEYSVGIYQYYLKYHPDIDKECATNIRCATEYAIKLIRENRIDEWACYAIITDAWI